MSASLRALTGCSVSSLLIAVFLLLSPWTYAQTSVTNVARVAPPSGYTNTNPSGSCTVAGVCSAGDMDVVTPSADLSLSKLSVNPNVAVGQTVTFTLSIGNAGPSPVSGATFSDVVPANFTAISIVSTSGGAVASVSGSTVSGTTSLAAGATSSVVVRAVASSTGAYTNSATVTAPAGTTDPNPANNTGTQSGTIKATLNK